MKSKIVKLAIIAATLCVSGNALAYTCADAVGTWDVTFKLVTDWTDRITIHSVTEDGAAIATNENGKDMLGVCNNGVTLLQDKESEFLIMTYVIAADETLGKVTMTVTNDFCATRPWMQMLVSGYRATTTKVIGSEAQSESIELGLQHVSPESLPMLMDEIHYLAP